MTWVNRKIFIWCQKKKATKIAPGVPLWEVCCLRCLCAFFCSLLHCIMDFVVLRLHEPLGSLAKTNKKEYVTRMQEASHSSHPQECSSKADLLKKYWVPETTGRIFGSRVWSRQNSNIQPEFWILRSGEQLINWGQLWFPTPWRPLNISVRTIHNENIHWANKPGVCNGRNSHCPATDLEYRSLKGTGSNYKTSLTPFPLLVLLILSLLRLFLSTLNICFLVFYYPPGLCQL